MGILGRSLSEIAKFGSKVSGGVHSKIVMEEDTLTIATDGTYAVHKGRVERCSAMEIWFGATGANYAGGDTVVVNFYKQINDVPFLAESVNVTTPAVTVGNSAKASVAVTGDLESYETYDIEAGSITIETTEVVTAVLGKKSQG